MQKTLTLKSVLVLAALTLAAGAASAEDKKQCFEDGLKNSWSQPTPNISLKHEADKEDRFDDKHASSFGEHEHDDRGTGISVSPVSEPATDAMLLAGLVMLGTLVRRKSKSTGSASHAAIAA